jgi:hypothetical protein
LNYIIYDRKYYDFKILKRGPIFSEVVLLVHQTNVRSCFITLNFIIFNKKLPGIYPPFLECIYNVHWNFSTLFQDAKILYKSHVIIIK